MKTWTVAVLLIAAVLAEKALARPEDRPYPEDEEELQDAPGDEQEENLPKPILKTAKLLLTPKPGDTVYLPCEVENANTVAWNNKSQSLAINDLRFTYRDDPRLVFHKNHTLEIRNVQPTDSGDYTCKLTEALTVTHELSVHAASTVSRISWSLLLGAVLILLTRS